MSLVKNLFSFLILLITIAIIAGILIFLEKTKPAPVSEIPNLPATRVITTKVTRGDIQTTHRITGRLLPSRRAELHFELAGLITQRPVEAGQYVQANSVLLAIAAEDVQNRVAEARLMIEQEQQAADRDQELLKLVRQQRQLLDRELGRQTSLSERALLPQSKMDETRRGLISARIEESKLKHSVQTAQTRLNSLTLDLERQERDLDRTQLVAPFAATINSISVEVGEYVTPGQIVIEMVDVKNLDLQLDVAGKVAAALKLGQQVSVTISDVKEKRMGELIALQVDPDPQTHTHTIRIRLSGDGLFAGQLAHVTLGEALIKDAILVPVSAVLQENNFAYVFVVKDSVVSRVAITVRGREADQFMIEGVSAGELIVSQDIAALIDGQTVDVINTLDSRKQP